MSITIQHKKEALGQAYIRAVIAKAGFNFSKSELDYAFDGTIKEVVSHDGRYYESGMGINFIPQPIRNRQSALPIRLQSAEKMATGWSAFMRSTRILLFLNVHSCALMGRKKHGWILCRIIAPVIMREKPMILSLDRLPMMMYTGRLLSALRAC